MADKYILLYNVKTHLSVWSNLYECILVPNLLDTLQFLLKLLPAIITQQVFKSIITCVFYLAGYDHLAGIFNNVQRKIEKAWIVELSTL